MTRLCAAFFALLLALPAAAQEATNGSAGVVRVLDKITGNVRDLEIPAGDATRIGLLEIRLAECRYPTGNPSGDAFALLTVFYRGIADPVFRGWMVASAPALNPMDHPRYDVWVLRCSTA